MSGKDLQEEAVLAAVKPLQTVEIREDSTPYANPKGSVARSDQAATASLENLFETHYDRVFRTAYRVTGNASDAEDVLQTVFLRVARDQESAESADNAEAYFSRAAINASLDLLRSRKRSKAVAIDDVENTASVSAFVLKRNPESDHEDHELRKLIRDAVAKLGSTAGEMFALRYFEGFGNAEIAAIMGTSPLVVGVTLHRARTRMRKEIGKYIQRG
jgi:RNA polymerase sigma-70 factor (ECF subfamily)